MKAPREDEWGDGVQFISAGGASGGAGGRPEQEGSDDMAVCAAPLLSVHGSASTILPASSGIRETTEGGDVEEEKVFAR